MNKKLTISLSIIAALILILIIANHKKSSGLPEFKPWKETADEIIIKKGEKTTRIYRENDRWLLGDKAYPADRELVADMENKMKNLELADLISDKPLYDRYNLSQDNATQVTVRKGKDVLRDIFIGKKSPTSRHSYIRLSQKPEIYLSSGSLTDEFNKSVEELRDKEIFKIDKNILESVTLTYKGMTSSFVKMKEDVQPNEEPKDKTAPAKKKDQGAKPAVWICNEFKNIKLNENSMNQIINSLESVKAASFSDIDPITLKGMLCRLKMKLPEKEITLLIHSKEKDGKYLCSSSESKYAFLLEAYRAEKYFQTIDKLKEKK